jgi:hypothetical protein
MQESWAKMTSPRGKLTACHPTKEENKAEELTYLYKHWSNQGILQGGGSITVLLTSCLTWFGLVCLAYKNKKKFSCHTADSSQTGDQQYSDTSPFSFPWSNSTMRGEETHAADEILQPTFRQPKPISPSTSGRSKRKSKTGKNKENIFTIS